MSYMPLRSDLAVETEELDGRPPSLLSKKNYRRPGLKKTRNGHSKQVPHKESYPIIVHSHLCWDWVWQRPQQFVSRLSRNHRVLFVETAAPDPELAVANARFRRSKEYPNLTILRVQFPAWCWNDGHFVDRERRRIVRAFVRGPGRGQFDRPVQWFYDPMAVTAYAGHMGEVLTVYDCMDELSKFRFAPPEIALREAELLSRAEVVFTGGRQLYESKRRFHDNCHFYGCGVDSDHFGRAMLADTPVPEELQQLSKPVFGYFGVIDERLDYALIAALADAMPQASVVMVGPVIKVEEGVLPRRKNLHWLGQRAYAELPSLCKGFDVCLMPFALNEATEFINPTKTLEYMATGRLIVSTRIKDVVQNFGDIVHLAGSAEAFIRCCRDAVEKRDPKRIERGLEKVSQHSWDSIVARLEQHVADALFKTSSVAAA